MTAAWLQSILKQTFITEAGAMDRVPAHNVGGFAIIHSCEGGLTPCILLCAPRTAATELVRPKIPSRS